MGNYKILNQNICFEDAVAAKNTAVSSNVLSKAIFPNSAELLFYIFLKLCRLGNIKFSCSIMGIQLRDAAEIDFFCINSIFLVLPCNFYIFIKFSDKI